MVRHLAGLAPALVAACLALTAGGGVAAAFTPDAGQQAEIGRVERYLNSVVTLKARFSQIAPDGEVSEGTFFLRRPGRLRFEYDQPNPVLVVADGVWLIYHDRELGQVNRWPVYATPLGVLVAEQIRLDGDMRVSNMVRQPGVLELTLVQKEKPGQGSLTLIFSDKPLELRQWWVVDVQGEVTAVALTSVEKDLKLDPKLFFFSDPRPAFLEEDR